MAPLASTREEGGAATPGTALKEVLWRLHLLLLMMMMMRRRLFGGEEGPRLMKRRQHAGQDPLWQRLAHAGARGRGGRDRKRGGARVARGFGSCYKNQKTVLLPRTDMGGHAAFLFYVVYTCQISSRIREDI